MSPEMKAFLRELADLLDKHDATLSCTNDMSGILFGIGGMNGEMELAWGGADELREIAGRAE